MNAERATLEVIALSVNEAIAKGLAELGLDEDEVDIEVLDEGGKGLLGIGGRQARVRLTIKGYVEPEKPQVPEKPKMAAPASRPAASAAPTDAETDNALSIARATVTELLEKMMVSGRVDAHLGEPSEPESPPPVVVEIHGNDLSILIGRKAETLNALQYIARLIVGKELGRSVNLLVDVEGYRSRRETSLRQLATRMAQQAVTTGRRQVLEPMSAAERRIIHMELQDHAGVFTESTGEEPRRKVMIIPKEE